MYAAGRKKSTHEVKYIFSENIIYGVDFFVLVASFPIRILITRGFNQRKSAGFSTSKFNSFLKCMNFSLQ